LTNQNFSDEIVAKPLRHVWRWVLGAVLVLAVYALCWSIATSPNIDGAVFGRYLFNGLIIDGAVKTIWITAISMVIATVLATLLAIMRLSSNPLLKGFSMAFVSFFRGTPLLLQIVFWGFLGLIWPITALGIPFTDIVFFQAKTSDVMSPIFAGIIALSLNEAAYASEIVRAGILSVDVGQTEAAKSLGMGVGYSLRRIVLPQAMRVIIPPMGNETISMLKSTAMLSLVAVTELYTRAQIISATNYKQVELMAVAGFWYLVMNAILAVPQSYLEHRYGKGVASQNERWLNLPFRGAKR
jgi:polar amino acid transport system permease protein